MSLDDEIKQENLSEQEITSWAIRSLLFRSSAEEILEIRGWKKYPGNKNYEGYISLGGFGIFGDSSASNVWPGHLYEKNDVILLLGGGYGSVEFEDGRESFILQSENFNDGYFKGNTEKFIGALNDYFSLREWPNLFLGKEKRERKKQIKDGVNRLIKNAIPDTSEEFYKIIFEY